MRRPAQSPTGSISSSTAYIFLSSERVRAALQQSGFAFPNNKRITVNLAPADLPKVTTAS
jgi:predicted ATPase with chaperone activity